MKSFLTFVLAFAFQQSLAASSLPEELERVKDEYRKLAQALDPGDIDEMRSLELLAVRIATLEEARMIESMNRLFPTIEPLDAVLTFSLVAQSRRPPRGDRTRIPRNTPRLERPAPEEFREFRLVKRIGSALGQDVFQIVTRGNLGVLNIRKDGLLTEKWYFGELELGKPLEAELFDPQIQGFESQIMEVFSDGTIGAAPKPSVEINASVGDARLRTFIPGDVTFIASPLGRLVGIVKVAAPNCRAFRR